MYKNNSAVNEFLGDLANDGNKDPINATPDESLFEGGDETPKEEETKEEVKEEKPIPFHKDPKVQRFIEKEISKRIADAQPKEVEKFVEDLGADEIDDVLTRIIGNDSPEKIAAIRDFKKVLLEREEKGAQKALDYFERQRENEVMEERKAEEELQTGFENIEEEFGVDITSSTPTARKTRSEFIDFVKRVAPKDSDGDILDYPDFMETFQLFQDTRKSTPEGNNRAKDLASRGMQKGGDASELPIQEDKSWNAVERILSKLTG